jgi:DNA polymerase I-like protein with 3'-5' exonuclease and polymerase domains
VDSETHLIQAGCLTPPLVCLSSAMRDANAPGGFHTNLFLREDAAKFWRFILSDPSLLLVIHNAPFDLGVACNEDPSLIFAVFDAINVGRAVCTIVIQKLIDVALGMRKFRRINGRVTKTTYALDDLIELHYNEIVQKKDTWRLSYALLEDVPLHLWPASAKQYAIYDSVLHLRLWEAQQRLIATHFGGNLPNQVEQQRANWVLHLMSMWGIRADAERVDYFIAHCNEEIQKMHQALLYCLHCGQPRKTHSSIACAEFKNTGIFKDDGSRTMAEIRKRVVESFTRQSMIVPMTDPSAKYPQGQVQTDKDTLELTDDPHLHVLAESMTFAKHLGQWGPVLRAAVHRPVLCRYEVLVETGRTASSGSEGQEGTNIQNPPRKGDVRPAVVPRPGWVYCATDADTIELRSHAQNCLELVGWSRMAERLIEQAKSKGPDLHEVLGAGIVGVEPVELQLRRKAGDVDMNDARQFAKIPNFGFPGGLGAETFVAYAAGQLSREAFAKWFGVDREKAVTKAKYLREVWFDTFPENRYYFEIVGKMIDRKKGYGTIQQLMSKRIRGETRFTAAANGFFQGRVADAMKEILWRLGMECYTGRETAVDGSFTGRSSVLFGSRPVMFLHDEPILEHPEATASERAERQRAIVVETLSKWLPNIPCTSSAVLMRRWQKGAEPLYIDGKLVPVKPEKVVGADGNTKIKWVEDRIAA